MPTVFTRILNGELPGRFVYRDDRSAAFLTIAPLKPGHTLVVPIEEIEHWLDLPDDLRDHLFGVAARIGRAIQQVWQPAKVGLMIAGLEVPHVHLHVVPIWNVRDLDFANQDRNPDPAALDDAMHRLRAAIGWKPQA